MESLYRPGSPRTNPSLARNFQALLLTLLFLAISKGCSGQDDQREFERQALQPPDGFTQTDGNGSVVNGLEDPDDWRTSPFYAGYIEFDPAWPNPALTTDAITIRFRVVTTDADLQLLRAEVYHPRDNRLAELDRIESPPGFGEAQFRFSPASLTRAGEQIPDGLYRIIITEERGNIVTYGDVKIE